MRPYEANTPLPIDPDAVLAGSITSQRLEVIVRRYGNVVQHPGVVQNSQLPQGSPLDVLGQGPAELAMPYPLGLRRSKADDHTRCITLYVMVGKAFVRQSLLTSSYAARAASAVVRHSAAAWVFDAASEAEFFGGVVHGRSAKATDAGDPAWAATGGAATGFSPAETT